MADFLAEAEADYAASRARYVAVLAEWEGLGEPLLSKGSTGQVQEHPLMKMLRELEGEQLKLRAAVAKRHAGPEPSAVLGGVPRSHSARLRAVNGSNE